MKGVSVVALLMLLLSMMLLVARQTQALDCGQVVGALRPCTNYLINRGTPSRQCCAGVSNVRKMASTQQDRRAACNCIKTAATAIPNLKPDAASNLAARCGVSMSIPISPTTNCNNIP